MQYQCEKCFRTSCKIRRIGKPVYNCGSYKDKPFTNADRLRETTDNIELAQDIFKFCNELSCNYDFSTNGILNYLNNKSE